jgi:hypothetical protein
MKDVILGCVGSQGVCMLLHCGNGRPCLAIQGDCPRTRLSFRPANCHNSVDGVKVLSEQAFQLNWPHRNRSVGREQRDAIGSVPVGAVRRSLEEALLFRLG